MQLAFLVLPLLRNFYPIVLTTQIIMLGALRRKPRDPTQPSVREQCVCGGCMTTTNKCDTCFAPLKLEARLRIYLCMFMCYQFHPLLCMGVSSMAKYVACWENTRVCPARASQRVWVLPRGVSSDGSGELSPLLFA